MTYEMADFQKDETKLRAKAKKGTITDEEFFKEIKRLHKRATESIVIEDSKMLLDTPYGYKQISSIEDDVAYLYDGAVVQLTPEEVDEISGNTVEEETDVGQVYEAGTSAGAKKAWDTRGRGRKAGDKPINPYPKSHPKHDDAEKNPNAYGKHQDSHIASYDMKNEEEQDFLNKQAKSIYDKGKSEPEDVDEQEAEGGKYEGYDVQIDSSMGTIAITKDGKDVWFSQSYEENQETFGDMNDWDEDAILSYLDSAGQMGEWESQLDSGYDPATGDKVEQPEGDKIKELETNKEDRAKGTAHTDLTLQKKWLNTPEDVEKATDDEIFALANGAQMHIAQGDAYMHKLDPKTNDVDQGVTDNMKKIPKDYYNDYMNSLRSAMKGDLFGSAGGNNEDYNYDTSDYNALGNRKDTRPTGADGQRLGKSDEEWEKEGYDVDIQRQNGIIAVTKNGEDVWFSQSHEDNVTNFGDDWDNWDTQLILNYLDGAGALEEFESKESKSNEEFKEDEHPRKDDGKFTAKGGGGSSDSKDGGKEEPKSIGLKDVWVSEKNYGFKSNDEGGLDLSLHDDMAGWMWNGDETDLVDYVNRVSGTDFKDEFIKKMDDSKVPFENVRDQMLRNLEENPDSLYAVSGDNRRWKFGEGTEIDMGIIDDEINDIAPDLTPEQTQQVKDTVDEFAEGGSYEGFMESEHGQELKGLVKEAIQNSNSFEDLFFQFSDWEKGLGYSKAELESYYNDQLTRDAIYSAVNNVKNQKEVTESKAKEGIEIGDTVDYGWGKGKVTYIKHDGNTGKVDGYKVDGKFHPANSVTLTSKAEEGLGREDHYGQDGYCPICDWKTIEPDWKTDLEYHLATGHGINGAEIVDIMRRAFESKANEDWADDHPAMTNDRYWVVHKDEEFKYSSSDNLETAINMAKHIFEIPDVPKEMWDSPANTTVKVWDSVKDVYLWTNEESKAREARIHQQTDIKKKWLERCETCGDIRSSHTVDIDHKFEVDATGVEFVDKGNVFENSILIKSGLQPKRYSKEYISQQIQYEAQKWWHDNYSKTHGRKDFRDMTIIEKKKVFLAFLESVVGYGAKLPDYKPTKKGKSYEEDVMSIYETVKRNADEVRKVLMEAKQVRFNNPDPKFWWNADEMRTGMVLNEFKSAGLEWYSVNSAGQLYNVLKDEAELVAGENKPVNEMSDDELLSAREYVYGTYRNHGYMRVLEAEIKDRGLGNPNFKKDWKDEETRDDKSVENDNKSEKDLEKIINENIKEDIAKFIEDPFTLYDKYKKGKGNDEIDKSLELEADEMHEDIEEAKPNTLIRYANPRKLPNGKTIMDRVRTSHPQVLESKATETLFAISDNQDWLKSHFSDWDGSCNICGEQMYVDDGTGGWEGEWSDLEEHLDKEHGIKYNGESKADEWWGEDESVVKFMNEVAEDLFGKKYKDLTQDEKDQVNMSMTSIYDPDLARVDKLRFANPELDSAMNDPDMGPTRDEDHYINDYESLATEDVKDEDWFKKYQRNVDASKSKISDLWNKDEKANEKEDVDLTCGMCNGTGEIYMDTIVTCHECNGTGKITFDQLPQWKKEKYASEGGFGSGKKGHSAWMKDIEFGGNYKKCPLCNINTNFTNGKCEICGNSFAGEKKKANETFYVEWDNGKGFFETEDMDEAKDKAKDNDGKVILVEDGMQDEQVYPAEESKATEMNEDEWMNKIEQLANKTGVKTIAVQNFLASVGSNGSVGNALANLDMDAGLYKWNARTRNAIQKGIVIYFDKVKKYDSPPTFEDKYPNTLW